MKIGERVRNSVRGREAMAGCRGAALTRVFVRCRRVRGITNAHPVPERTPGNSKNRAARPELNQVRLDYSLVHNSIMERRPPSVTAASFKYGQKYRKCSGRNVMNANGFKKLSMTVLTAGSVSDKICRYASSIMAPASSRHAVARPKQRTQAGVAHHH